MSVKCDFCDNDNITRSDLQFIASRGKSVHICEECILQAVGIISVTKEDEEFKRVLQERTL